MRLDDFDDGIRVEDQRGGNFGGGGGGFGGGGLISLLFGILPLLMGRKLGCGTIAILAVVGFLFFSSGALQFGGADGGSGGTAQQGGSTLAESCNIDAASKEACNTLASLDKTWADLVQGYERPKLVFYSNRGQSGCGAAQSQMGPFYCPSDNGVYLDTSFFQQMEQQLGAKGDFARAYVIAHEVGHHIQNITGRANQVRQAQSRVNQAQGNALQVRMELEADCFAGVWAARNKDRIEPGDFEEGMTAAASIGDDTLMRNAGQRPVESAFTHGTSEQRMRWLRKGLETGNPRACDTFSGPV
ncbi:neutral zinc metallopeptidase [Sphingorhabdus arenilitoris]|uniref:Neutral zinc metallopeptidase n=1 Tax=Sphingorhabdus arenilitoris TaxID=1490041 RepID=A0ABV8RFT0_9SPHN